MIFKNFPNDPQSHSMQKLFRRIFQSYSGVIHVFRRENIFCDFYNFF